MIDLSSMHIDQYNGVIETRKKIYRLALDLKMPINIATQFATLVSELLQALLVEQQSVNLRLAFTKEQSHYHFHIFITCSELRYPLCASDSETKIR